MCVFKFFKHTYKYIQIIHFSYEYKHCCLLLLEKLSDTCKDFFYGAQWDTELTPLFVKKKNVNKSWEITRIE